MTRLRPLLAPLLALVLLGVIAAAGLARPEPADAAPYHARVREAVAQVPTQIGDWVGRDEEIPRSAVELLKPNALLSRAYSDLGSGHVATFVVVHTRDARDMAGHYPPQCYPSSGWTQEAAEPGVWDADGLEIEGMEYRFRFDQAAGAQQIVITNFMVLPDGRFARSMGEVRRLASDYTRHFFGAGQVQVLTAASLPDDERRRVVETILAANRPLIDTIRSGLEAPSTGRGERE